MYFLSEQSALQGFRDRRAGRCRANERVERVPRTVINVGVHANYWPDMG